jgi:hypothetical protein
MLRLPQQRNLLKHPQALSHRATSISAYIKNLFRFFLVHEKMRKFFPLARCLGVGDDVDERNFPSPHTSRY